MLDKILGVGLLYKCKSQRKSNFDFVVVFVWEKIWLMISCDLEKHAR